MSGTEEDAANLQLRLAVKQAAELWNMSQRSVSMVRAVQRFRPELAAEIAVGNLTVTWRTASPPAGPPISRPHRTGW